MKHAKIDALKAKAEAKASAIVKAEKEIAELEAKISQIKEQAAEAASAGDYEKYQTLSAEAEAASQQLYVKRSFMEMLNSKEVPEAEIIAAWAEYAADCDKQFNKLFADYESKRKALFDSYSALIELQGEAIKMQNQLLNSAGINGKDIATWRPRLAHKLLETGHPQRGAIRMMNGVNYTDPDVVFYLSNYERENGVHFNAVLDLNSAANMVLAILGNRSF